MARKGENIFKRQDGRWEARYIKGYNALGKAQYGYVYAKTYLDVKKKRSVVIQNLDTAEKDKMKSECFFQELCVLWLDRKRTDVKMSTYARYYKLIHTHIIPELGSYPVHMISTQVMESFIQKLFSTGKLNQEGGLSHKSVSDILVIVKSIMKYAAFCEMRIICDMEQFKIRKPKHPMRVFTIEEQSRLYHYLIQNMDLTALGILLALCTGIRIGELCALKWENVKIKSKVLKINATMQRVSYCDDREHKKTFLSVTEPKSECSVREIPLPDLILPYLDQLKRGDQMFILSGTARQIEPRTIQNRFKAILRKLGIQEAGFHCLRHTFATRCVEMNFEMKSLSEILGHANVNITLNCYVHSSLKLKQKNMEKFNELLVRYS